MFSEGSDEAIQNYSNPDVNVEGQPTGITDARDNARILEQSACTVSGFRTLAPSLAVSLNGPYTGCVGDGAEVCAEIEGGTPGSYTLKWYVADEDGINYQYLPYNDDETCLYYPFPPAVPEKYWIKVAVSDGQGNSAIAVHTLRTICGGEMGLMDNPGGSGINVFPNPVGSGDIDLTFDLDEDAETGFSISLINGKEILTKDLGFLPKGSYRFRTDIDMQGLQMLVLKVRKGNKVESRKFIVNR
ncbi:MAG: T9SS C-terminal target domain-containing protein [Bacteroidetes bacterium]|nr:MAG: T9SS C-terminal target domain-containing protein [Bacteroidota bacterium]